MCYVITITNLTRIFKPKVEFRKEKKTFEINLLKILITCSTKDSDYLSSLKFFYWQQFSNYTKVGLSTDSMYLD